MSAEERAASCDRLRQLEARIRADMAQQAGVNTRSLAELRRVQTALIQHCS